MMKVFFLDNQTGEFEVVFMDDLSSPRFHDAEELSRFTPIITSDDSTSEFVSQFDFKTNKYVPVKKRAPL